LSDPSVIAELHCSRSWMVDGDDDDDDDSDDDAGVDVCRRNDY